jgi:hypothetical protein
MTRTQSHSSTPPNSPPTPRRLTVPYPAIKITEQSASVVGGSGGHVVNGVQLASNAARLHCIARRSLPVGAAISSPRGCTRVNALWKAAAVTAGSVPDVAVRADREAENPMVGGPIVASTASTKVECAVRVSNPGPAD